MKGIGDPRTILALARLPERGLRGCAILYPIGFQQRNSSSFGGAGAGRGGGEGRGAGRGGVGSAQLEDEGPLGRRREDGDPFGRSVPQEGIEVQGPVDGFSHQEVSTEEPEGWRNRTRVEAGAGRGGGRGRGAAGPLSGISFAPRQQQQQEEDDIVNSRATETFGRGRGTAIWPHGEAGRGRGILPSRAKPPFPSARPGRIGEQIPQSASDESPSKDDNVSQATHGNSEQQGNLDPLPSPNEPPKESAVEILLAKLSRNEPSAVASPQSPSPAPKPTLPFRLPFGLPPSASEQAPRTPSQTHPPVASPRMGRGRGQPGAVSQPGIGVSEPESVIIPPRRDERIPDAPERGTSEPRSVGAQQQMAGKDSSLRKRGDRMSDNARRLEPRRPPPSPPSPPSPPRMSVEEARARAISILEQGVERNMAAEGDRRRNTGMEKFAGATDFLADRSRRSPGQSSSTRPQQSPREERQRLRRGDRPRRQRPGEEVVAEQESALEVQLTPEQEAELVRMQEEDTFTDRLHTLFLTQFEPEFAMEEFGRNPDIDEPPVLSLDEYLQSYKPYFVRDDAELSEQQKWQEAVKSSLANAPNLEKLVEAYAGRGRMTARQQIDKMQTIHDKLPATVAPEVADFSQRAFLTLQNNPHLNMRQKERLMTNIVAGFS